MKLALLALSVLVAGCSSGPASDSAPSVDATGDDPIDAVACSGPAVWHAPGGVPLDIPTAARGCHAYTGRPALEPSLGIDADGALYFQVFQPENAVQDRAAVLRSTDNGTSWDDVSPRIAPTGISRHPSSGDPFLWTDPDTGRVFTGDFVPPCHQVSFSADRGLSWTTTIASCDIIDHQAITTGPPVTSAPIGYSNVAYLCGPAGIDSRCVKSIDGGLTWTFTGALAYPPTPGNGEIAGVACNGGGHGHPQTGADGALYLAKGNLCGQPWLAISRDEGASWTRHQVADIGGAWHEAEADATADGILHYAWVAADLLPYYATSTDGGATWSVPMMVGPPGIEEASQPGLAVGDGDDATVAITYLARIDEARADCGAPCPPGSYAAGTWHGFITLAFNGTGDARFLTADTHDPRERIVEGACGQARCQATGDFHDIVVDRHGRAWGAFADLCFEGSCDNPSHAGAAFARGFVAWIEA